MNLLHRLALRNYLFWAVVMGFILLAALIVLPFIGAIISAYILAYLVRPLFLWLKPKYGTVPSALICVIITIIVIIVPIGLISLQILTQVGEVPKSQAIADIANSVAAQPLLKNLNIDSVGLKAWINLAINNIISSAIQSIPSFALGLIITLNGMFYLLCKWDNLSTHLKNYLPFNNNAKIITDLSGTADAIIHGHVFIAVLEAVIAFVGFSLIGIQASLIFAVLIFILAFVPSVGPLLVWAPLALYYLSIHQYVTMWEVIAIGLTLLIGIEFILYTRFVGSKSHIHPFIMLIGVLGGISVFGVFGFIIGPLLLANSIDVLEVAVVSHGARAKKS